MVDFSAVRTVRWMDEVVVMIDQTKLPSRFMYVRCKSHFDVADAIRRMVVRGAPAIGVSAAMGLALAAVKSEASSRDELMRELKAAGEVLKATRPTAVNLAWALERVLSVAASMDGGVEDVRRAVVGETQAMADEDVEANRRLGRYGSSLIDDGDVVLTHCRWPVSR